MITKKELLIFSISFLAIIILSFSGGENKNNSIVFDTKEDKLLVGNIKFRNFDLAQNHRNRNLKNKKDLRIFKKRMQNSNFDQVIRKVQLSASKKLTKKSAKKVSVPKVAKKKKDDKKKKKDDKKKKVAKKKSKLSPIKALNPNENNKVANSLGNIDKLESTNLASLTYTQTVHPSKKANDQIKGEDKKDASIADNTREKEESSDNTSGFGKENSKKINKKSLFTELLETERFSEFEQLLQSKLSEKQRIQSYKDSLNFLFSRDEESFGLYDSFIYNQFFNDRHAVIISKSLNDPEMSFEQVRYSITYLNQVVINWDSPAGSSIFKKIYQDNVMKILSANEERKDLITGLQSSIEAKSLLLDENTIEVSAN